EEDHKAFELVSSRNQCDAMIHSVKKSLAEHGDKLDGDEKSNIESALKEAEEALKTNEKETIDAKTQALTEASHKLAEKMYSQEQAHQTQEGPTDSEPKNSSTKREKTVEGEVVDAEFEEVKDKK
nr:Hsp70 family protein [Nitrosomonas sp.]